MTDPTLPVVYVAGPLSAPTSEAMAENRMNAARWCGWLARHCGVAPVAPWIHLSMVWTEEEGRELGLEIDKAVIDGCAALILTGGRISSGMQIEADFAREIGVPVVDLTTLGRAAPYDGFNAKADAIRGAMRAALEAK